MEQSVDRIVLAIECGHCQQITGVQVHHGTLYIVRCGLCGQTFPAADALVRQYQAYADRLACAEKGCQRLQDAHEAMHFALEHWGHPAGKERLLQALDPGTGVEHSPRTPGGRSEPLSA